MTRKERLVELLKTVPTTMGGLIDMETVAKYADEIIDIEQIADDLLSNGVIVPPCKVGDTVWFHCCWDYSSIVKGEVTAIVEREGVCFLEICSHGIILGRLFDEVFLTCEEAEQALKERENDG